MLIRISLVAVAASLSIACSEQEGSLTAHIVWPNQGLRAEAVPPQIARLQIVALDGTNGTSGTSGTSGSTLAETNLYLAPADGQIQLNPAGGTWTLDNVKVGENRMIVARAYLPTSADPRINGLVLYDGAIENVEVRPGELVDAGPLRLKMRDGVRYPPLDREAPEHPMLNVTAVDEGEALWVNFTRPPQDDVAGYIIALSLTGATATIARGAQFNVGDPLGPNITVVHRLWVPEPETRTIVNLTNGRAYTVLIYAYDSDLGGFALNYSQAETALGVPLDTKPPGMIRNLSLVPGVSAGTAQLAFTAPGEDGDSGLPRSYEVHTSTSLAALNDPSLFGSLPQVPAPPVQEPGELVQEDYTFAQLKQTGMVPFYVGVRAMDVRQNGPIATAMFTANATVAPSILDLAPPIVLAGTELAIVGRDLGAGGLAVLDTGTGTIALDVVRWSNSTVSVSIPIDAASGVITLTRLPDGAKASAYIVVVSKQANAFNNSTAPFELVSVANGPGTEIAALYREADIGNDYEAAIERVIDGTPDTTPLAPFVQTDRSTAIAGAYDPGTQRIVFVASNQPNSMTYASVTTLPATPAEERSDVVAMAGGADRVSLAVFPQVFAGEISALIAFSYMGKIRTATIADLRTQQFPLFWVTESATVGTSYDQVTVHLSTTGETYMAYRETTAGVTKLGLRHNPDPRVVNDFNEVAPSTPTIMPSEIGRHLELLGVPNGVDEQVIVVYEEWNPVSGSSEVRLLRVEDFGSSLGYAPFDIAPEGRVLDDVGLVLRQGEVWIAVLTERGSSVQYTEVPMIALGYGEAQRGLFRGVILDSAGGNNVGRIGCKFVPAQECPIAWLGTNVQVLFNRR